MLHSVPLASFLWSQDECKDFLQLSPRDICPWAARPHYTFCQGVIYQRKVKIHATVDTICDLELSLTQCFSPLKWGSDTNLHPTSQ